MENLFELYQNTLINEVRKNGNISAANLAQLMNLHKQDINPELLNTDEGLELLPVDDYIPGINVEKVKNLKSKLEKDIEKVSEKTNEEKELLNKKLSNFNESIRYNSMIDLAKENLKTVTDKAISDHFTKIKVIEENYGNAEKVKQGLKDIDNLPDVKKAKETIEKLETKQQKLKENSINPNDYETTLKFLDSHEIELQENLLNQFKSDLSLLKFKGGLSVLAELNNEFKAKLNGNFAIKTNLDQIEQKEIIQHAKDLINLIDENIEPYSHILKHSLGVHPDTWDLNSVPSPVKKPLKLAKLLGDDYFKRTYKNQIELQFGDKKVKYSLDEINNLETVPNEKYDYSKSYMENFRSGITKRRPVLNDEREKWIEQIKEKVKDAVSDSNKIYIVKKDLANGLLALRTLAGDNKYFKHYHSN